MNFKQLTKKEMVASRVYKLSASQCTVSFVKSLLFGGIMSLQHNNTNTNETKTSKQKKRKAYNRPHYIYFTLNCHNWSAGVTGMKLVIGDGTFCHDSNCLGISQWNSTTVSMGSSVRLI